MHSSRVRDFAVYSKKSRPTLVSGELPNLAGGWGVVLHRLRAGWHSLAVLALLKPLLSWAHVTAPDPTLAAYTPQTGASWAPSRHVTSIRHPRSLCWTVPSSRATYSSTSRLTGELPRCFVALTLQSLFALPTALPTTALPTPFVSTEPLLASSLVGVLRSTAVCRFSR